MKEYLLLTADLHLFEGGAAGAGGAAAGDGAGDGSAQGGTNAAVPGNTRRGRSGEYANVKFGVQPEDTGASDAGKQTDVSVTSNTLEERRAAFQKFLTDNKDLDDERQQTLFNRRFKDYKTLQDAQAKNQPVIDMMLQRYKITDGDLSKLTEAIENDDRYYEEAAEEAGMTVEQFKRFQKLQRENEQLVKQQQARIGQEQAETQLRKWQQEADALKAKFSSFDLNTEIQDQHFKAMLRAGVPMEQAYKVLHMDAMMNDAVGNAAAEAERRVVNNVRARGNRPVENGTAAQSGFTVKDDVSKLTRKDRAEIARLAAMGEKITFGRR